MKFEQEPKYMTNPQGQILNRETGMPIPDDEPVFIMRAQDINAVNTMRYYRDHCSDPDHKRAVQKRINQFTDFAVNNVVKMGEPDTLNHETWPGGNDKPFLKAARILRREAEVTKDCHTLPDGSWPGEDSEAHREFIEYTALADQLETYNEGS